MFAGTVTRGPVAGAYSTAHGSSERHPRHAPGQVGGAYRIEATINHTTSGGPADITFRLRNKTTSEIIESSGGVNLTPGVALAAVAELRAPEGDYTPEVEVKYPAR